MWLMIALMAVAASSLFFESSEPSDDSENISYDEDTTHHSEEGSLKNFEVNDQEKYIEHTSTDSEYAHDSDSSENTHPEDIEVYLSDYDLNTDLLEHIEGVIVSNLNEFNSESDVIIWHRDPSEIQDFHIDHLTFNEKLVYPELQEVSYKGILLAHIERDAYGI